jgi:hypothetical protein
MPSVIAAATLNGGGGDLTLTADPGGSSGAVNLSDGPRSITLSRDDQRTLGKALRSTTPQVVGHGRDGKLLWRVTNGEPDESGDSIRRSHTLTVAGADDDMESLVSRPGVRLTERQVNGLDDTLARLGVARRMETGYGPLDMFVTEKDEIAFRMKDDNGGPTEVAFGRQDWRRIADATDLLVEGFDESGPEDQEEINDLVVKTSAGPVEMHWRGQRVEPGYAPDSRLIMAPQYDAAWSMVVDGAHMSQVLGHFGWLEEAAGAARMASRKQGGNW